MENTLFDLTAEYLTIMELLTDPDQPEQVITDTLDAIMGEIEVKSEGYVAVLNHLKMELEACKIHEQAWKRKKQVRENNIKRMKKALADTMIATEKEEIKAGDNTIKLVNNGGKLPLEITVDVDDIPNAYTIIKKEPNNDKIRAALDAGEELPFAHYGERGKNVMIK